MSTDNIAELKAELANIFPLLRDSENQNAALAKTLADYKAELDTLREAFNEVIDENEALKKRLEGLACGDHFEAWDRYCTHPKGHEGRHWNCCVSWEQQ